MKIIASDFDGTLAYKGGISDGDRRAIEAFRHAGHKFGIVTGRDMPLARGIIDGHHFLPDFLICCTGALILGADGSILYKKQGKMGDFLTDIFYYALSLGAESFTVSDGLLKYFADISGIVPLDLSAFCGFTQVNARFPSPESAETFTAYVGKQHSLHITAHRNGRDVDMPPAGTSKVTGIYEYAKQFDSPDIYTVGDNANDLPMICEFCGFAVSNAVDAVKAEADHLCDRVCDVINHVMQQP